MMDQYKEQYKKETEQIHAPADLIAKTKAAVREEEMRIQRERAAQTVRPGVQEISAVPKKPSRGMTARKWAYPLTIAASILVLVSVSMMMRGMGKTSLESPMYETTEEADSGAEEFETETAAAEAAPEETFALEEAPEEPTAGAAFDAGIDSTEETGAVTDDTERASGAPAKSEMTESADEEKRAAASDEPVAEAEGIDDAMSQKKAEAVADLAASVESVTIKKVRNKPVFVDRADTESRTYEEVVFRIIKEGDEWIAYVESESGGGYVIRGEADTIEAFLEAGYEKLSEISY